MSNTAIDEAVAVLRRGYVDALNELRRIEDALASLGYPVPNTQAVPPTPSVRTTVVALLNEADREWSAPEILAELEAREIELNSVRPADAIRTALIEALKRGEIVRPSYGRYKALQFADQGTIFKNEPGLAEEEAALG